MSIYYYRRNGQIRTCPIPRCGTEISDKGIKGWDNLKFLFEKLVEEAGMNSNTAKGIDRSLSQVLETKTFFKDFTMTGEGNEEELDLEDEEQML